MEEGPAQVSREDIQRRIVVQDERARARPGSFVADAQQAMRKNSTAGGLLRPWGGQFENLERASRRLMLVVPLALSLIFVLLYTISVPSGRRCSFT